MDDLTALARIDSFPYAHRMREVMSASLLTADAATALPAAIAKMQEARVSSIIALDGDGRPAGIFTERDYARKIVLKGRLSPQTQVQEVMTSSVMFVTPVQTSDYCMALMTEKHLRHLPDEIIRLELLIGIPSDQPAAKDHPPRRGNAVGVA